MSAGRPGDTGRQTSIMLSDPNSYTVFITNRNNQVITVVVNQPGQFSRSCDNKRLKREKKKTDCSKHLKQSRYEFCVRAFVALCYIKHISKYGGMKKLRKKFNRLVREHFTLNYVHISAGTVFVPHGLNKISVERLRKTI